MPKPSSNPWEAALSTLEANRRALGTSQVRVPTIDAWVAQQLGTGPASPSAFGAESFTGESPTSPSTPTGGGFIPDEYLDYTGYQILQSLGPAAYQAYLWSKAGVKPGSTSTDIFGMPQSDWDRLTPAQQRSYTNKLTGLTGGDAATLFGLSGQEWQLLSPAQRESLVNYVSRYDPTGGASGDPYAGQKMQLAWAQLAQERAMAEAQLAQRRKEMASNIGQQIASMRMQGWQTGLPWSLPKGAAFAPALGPGGPMQQLYALSGATYSPREYLLAKNNPPSSDQLSRWIAEAMGRFG